MGDEDRVYYDDRNSATEGSTDYAFIEDFNPAQDKIQLRGDRDRMFYNDRNPATTGDTDYALIKGFDFSQDTIQLQGDRSMYDLSFYTDGSGTTFTNIFLYAQRGLE